MEALHLQLNREIVDKNISSEVMREFNKLITDEDRVECALQIMEKLKMTVKVPITLKNNTLSEKYRAEGNKLFLNNPLNEDKFSKILKLYTKAIAYAEPKSKELSYAYGNRSAILLQLGDFRNSINDIGRALSLGCSNHLQLKLLTRKMECLLELGITDIVASYNIALKCWKLLPEKDPNKERFKKKLQGLNETSKSDNIKKPNNLKYQIKVPIIQSQNPEVPCASDAVAIKYNKKYGRHVVATRNISPGEVIAVERPYSYCLSPHRIYSHCANCLRGCVATIPCDHCYISMYCSIQCRSEHWKNSHEIECSLFSILYEMSNYIKLNFMTVRVVIDAIKEAGNIFTLRNLLKLTEEKSDPRTKGFGPDKQFQSDRFISIYSLQTNSTKRSTFDLFRRAVDSAILLYLMINHSTIFGKKYEMNLKEIIEYGDAKFIGGLLLTVEQLIPTNAHSLEELHDFDNHERAMVLMAFYSLFNHCCDPNVVRISMGRRVVMRALYPIMEGEQLFDNYSVHYAVMPKVRRQEALLRQYHFYCECVPCQENWLTHIEISSYEEFVKIPHQKAIIEKALSNLESYMVFIATSRREDIESKKDIIKDLLKMIEILYKRVPLPCHELNRVVETVKYYYNTLANVYELPGFQIIGHK